MNSIKALFLIWFRFQPTYEELVSYFLFRKINGHSMIQDGKVKDVDIYKHEPMKLYDIYRFKVLCVCRMCLYRFKNKILKFILDVYH